MSHTRVRLSVPTESLRQEHRKIRDWLREYSALPLDERQQREWLFDRIHRQLLLHFAVEEEVVYPAVRNLGVKKAIESVEEAQWSHRLLRQVLTELSQMSTRERPFDSKMEVLRMNFEQYLDAEEQSLFPELRDLSREQRESLHGRLEELREQLERGRRG